MTRKRVVIVDDSMTMRAMIARALSDDGRFDVVGEAEHPFAARDIIKQTNPDVLTLDVEMPRMDGISFLEKIMKLRPMPVVMFSSETHKGSRAAIEALSLGAIDCVGKPTTADPAVLSALADRVFVAAGASVAGRRPKVAAQSGASFIWNGKTVLIGASTGGVDALERVLTGMPENGPPVLITQHMPESFLASFADRLRPIIRPRVSLAAPGSPIAPGHVYLAPGGAHHLILEGRDDRLRCGLATGDKVSGHRPSVDVLFQSAVQQASRMVAVLLTGMGRDGAEGMVQLRAGGAHTIAQDAATCVVYGMPRVAVELGAVRESKPIDLIAGALLAATCRGAGAGARAGMERPGVGQPPARLG